MKTLIAIGFVLVLSGCSATKFEGGAAKASSVGDASGVISQSSEMLCAENGLVPKPSDSPSDDDSSSVDSVDDDSVDGVSADGVSSDDDSSDEKACADLASCLKKKCQPPPAAPVN